MIVHKLLCGHVDILSDNFLELRSTTTTRGHPYKLFKRQCVCTVRSSFFTERVDKIWNCLPSDTVDFSSLTAFQRTIKCVDSVISSTLHSFLRAGIVSLPLLFCYVFLSRATVSAVFQPPRTCHMLFVLLAVVTLCVVCVLGK